MAARCSIDSPEAGCSGARNGSVNRRHPLGRGGGGATRWPAEFCQVGAWNRSRQRGQMSARVGTSAHQEEEEDDGRRREDEQEHPLAPEVAVAPRVERLLGEGPLVHPGHGVLLRDDDVEDEGEDQPGDHPEQDGDASGRGVAGVRVGHRAFQPGELVADHLAHGIEGAEVADRRPR